MNDLVDNIATRVDLVEKRTYQILVPKRFQETQPAPGAPPAAARRRGSKQAPEPVVPAVPAPIPEVRIHTEPTPLVTYVYGYLRSFYDVLLMASFVPFLVYFMLSWRDHMRRSFLYMFGSAGRQVVGKSWEGVADMVRDARYSGDGYALEGSGGDREVLFGVSVFAVERDTTVAEVLERFSASPRYLAVTWSA